MTPVLQSFTIKYLLIVIANYYILITLTTYISQLAKSGLLKAKRLKKYPCLEYKTNYLAPQFLKCTALSGRKWATSGA